MNETSKSTKPKLVFTKPENSSKNCVLSKKKLHDFQVPPCLSKTRTKPRKKCQLNQKLDFLKNGEKLTLFCKEQVFDDPLQNQVKNFHKFEKS